MEVQQGVELYNKTGRELVQFISCWLDGGRSDLYSITREKSAISLLYSFIFSASATFAFLYLSLICWVSTLHHWSWIISQCAVYMHVWHNSRVVWERLKAVCVSLCVRGWEAHMVDEKNAQQGEWNMSVCITSGLFKNAAISIWTVCVCQGVPAAVEQSEVILQKRRSLLIDRLLCGVKWSWSETLH